MSQPSSYRRLVVAAAATSLGVGAAMIAPGIAGASTHGHRRAKSGGVEIRLEKARKYGVVLADGAGRSLYYLSGPGGKPLPCKAGCAAIWPPLLTAGKPRAAKGVDAKMLGTVPRGSALQVTYDGRPLYRFAGDTAAGQVNGEEIRNFGGTWYLLGSKGAPVHAALTSARSSKGTKGSSSKGKKGSSSTGKKASSSGGGSSSAGW